jgi:hypothetical protein
MGWGGLVSVLFLLVWDSMVWYFGEGGLDSTATVLHLSRMTSLVIHPEAHILTSPYPSHSILHCYDSSHALTISKRYSNDACRCHDRCNCRTRLHAFLSDISILHNRLCRLKGVHVSLHFHAIITHPTQSSNSLPTIDDCVN